MGKRKRNHSQQKEPQEIQVAKLNFLGVTTTALLSLVGVVLTAYFSFLASTPNSHTVATVPTVIPNSTSTSSTNLQTQPDSNSQSYILYAVGIGCLTSIIIIFGLGNVLSKKFPRFVFEMASRKTIVGVRREPKAYLIDNSSGRQFALFRSTKVGKDPKRSEFLINNDDSVSGIHCSILEVDGRFLIKDEDSTNGTTVNGTRLNSNEIKQIYSGDVIQVGQQRFTFETSRL